MDHTTDGADMKHALYKAQTSVEQLHALFDWWGIPRATDDGERYTLYGRASLIKDYVPNIEELIAQGKENYCGW